jgi:hypothetical protein
VYCGVFAARFTSGAAPALPQASCRRLQAMMLVIARAPEIGAICLANAPSAIP